MSQTCCVQEHLPHNEMNPQCYKSASGGVGRIPYAGWLHLFLCILLVEHNIEIIDYKITAQKIMIYEFC